MDPIVFLIAQFLTPFSRGLDVVPFEGPARAYPVEHAVGVYLIMFRDGILTVTMVFRSSPIRTAGDYLHDIEKALAFPVPLDDKTQMEFVFQKNLYEGYDRGMNADFHSATFRIKSAEALPELMDDMDIMEAEAE
ncbi:MAG: hypothetical protein ABIW76_14420 [Fibrobacteria bacterium]